MDCVIELDWKLLLPHPFNRLLEKTFSQLT